MAAEWIALTITRFAEDYPSWIEVIDVKNGVRKGNRLTGRFGSYELASDITVDRPHHIRFLNIDKPQHWPKGIRFP